MERLDPVDVVIVGAGAAGSVYAATLAEAGKRVLILERGRERKLGDLYSSQIWARRLKWGSSRVVQGGADDIWFNFNAGHGYGGAALHHYALWPRFREDDFRVKSLYGRAVDWPFEYADLRPYYDRVQRDVGISGDAAKEPRRPAGDPYPLPPALVSNHGRIIARGFEALEMRTSPIPLAILTAPYKGRPACLWDGWCDAGCPIGALANPLTVYIPRATKAGAQLRADANVVRVVTDSTGKRAIGVEYLTSSGERKLQRAGVIVLCAFTIENSRILLSSASSQSPRGLANSSGSLGRYLMSHPALSVFGLFDADMQNYIGASAGQLYWNDLADKRSDPGGAFGGRQWEIANAMKPNDLLGLAMSRPDIFGSSLHNFMRRASRSLGLMIANCEDEPLYENAISLAAEADMRGIPLARVTYKTSPEGLKLWKSAAAEGLRIFKAAGAQETWHGGKDGAHIMGGTRMGSDPAASVLNGFGQAYDIPNLFVGGPSVFPTSSGANPTFTVHAVAMRSAEFIARNWSSVNQT